MTEEFHIYSKLGCTHCETLKQIFIFKGISFKEYRYPEDFNVEYFRDLFGRNATFPQVLHNEKRIGGTYDTVSYLKENEII